MIAKRSNEPTPISQSYDPCSTRKPGPELSNFEGGFAYMPSHHLAHFWVLYSITEALAGEPETRNFKSICENAVAHTNEDTQPPRHVGDYPACPLCSKLYIEQEAKRREQHAA